MKFLFFMQDTVKKTLGVILIVPGTFLLFIALFGIIGGDKPEDFNIGVGVSIFSLFIIVPGILLYRKGLALAGEEAKVRKLVSMLLTYRRMSIQDMASKLGVTEPEAHNLLAVAVDQNLVNGHMDRPTNEFFVSTSVNDIKKLTQCPYCGAPVTQVFHKDETAKCPSCGQLFH
ncbi:MAG TPA: PCI domain-containing protein [Spirochaetota bacterium]|nr:PCI domain-containing protein [Spirochaetota bacterium]HQO39055.1 PCI domain-containing protein [Spirochaetota bacterium]